MPIKLTDIQLNTENPRTIRTEKFIKLKESIQQFPKMMELRPIVIDEGFTILGGNMRYRALVELGFSTIPDNWVKVATELSDEEKRRFIVEDNLMLGEWDYDILGNLFTEDELSAWGFEFPENVGEDEPVELGAQGEEKKRTCPNCGYEL